VASDVLTPYARNALEQAVQARRARANAVSIRRAQKSATPKLPLAEERALERYLTTLTREAADQVREAVARGVAINDLLPLEQILAGLRLRLAERIQSSEVSEIVDSFGRRVNQRNLTDTARVLRMSPDALPTSVRSVLDAFRWENVRLIGSVLDDQISEVSEIVRDAVRTGRRVEDLAEDIEARFGVSESRARLIARDQVLKANSDMTQTRMTAAGITRYRWSTSRDERVRPMHRELEGQIFSWSDPPITNPKGDRNHPGRDYQCRCVQVPVLDFEETDAETAFRRAFPTRPGA
jgi:SPP1 gp7 family putative phage head morphogenesis protein